MRLYTLVVRPAFVCTIFALVSAPSASSVTIDEMSPKARGNPDASVLIERLTYPSERADAIAALSMMGEAVVPHLTKALDSQSEQMRIGVVIALGELRRRSLKGNMPSTANRIEDILLGLFRDESKAVAQQAIVVLAYAAPRPKRAIPVLLGLLRDGPDNLRQSVLIALGKFGPDAADAIPFIHRIINDRGNVARRCACHALGAIGSVDQRSVAMLRQVFKDSTEDLLTRSAALSGLDETRPGLQAVVFDIIDVLKEANQQHADVAQPAGWQDFRRYLLMELNHDLVLPDEALPPLVAIIQDRKSLPDSIDRAIAAVGAIRPAAKNAVPFLIQLLDRQRNPSLRVRIIETLGRMGPAAVDALPLLRIMETKAKGDDLKRRIRINISKIARD